MFKYLLYRLGQLVVVALPLKITYGIAVFLADLHRLISKRDRMAVMENLRAIAPEASNEAIEKNCRSLFRNFAKYLVEFFRFSIVDKQYIQKNLSIEGLEKVDKALLKKNGVLIVSAHMANWEFGGIAMAMLKYPIACVALKHRDKRINKFFTGQREKKGMEVIPLGQAAPRCLYALKKNKLLALVGDRDFTNSGIKIDLFGKLTTIPRGPAAFSIKTGAPLLLGILLRQKNNKLRFIYEGPFEIDPSGDYEQDVNSLTEKYISVIKEYIKANPDQWLIFRKFWEPLSLDVCD